ncbi:uncharacterized protein [Musca autumnalis]|uniref:uncharacterized protein n=1 Tax=Musca autumnalis TaxID=221902 RepID=UPI003CF17CDB
MSRAYDACIDFGQSAAEAAEVYGVPLQELLRRLEQHEPSIVVTTTTLNTQQQQVQRNLEIALEDEIELCTNCIRGKQTYSRETLKDAIENFGTAVKVTADKHNIPVESLYFHLKKIPTYIQKKQLKKELKAQNKSMKGKTKKKNAQSGPSNMSETHTHN